MAILKMTLLLVVACGVFSSAYAGKHALNDTQTVMAKLRFLIVELMQPDRFVSYIAFVSISPLNPSGTQPQSLPALKVSQC